MKSYNVQNSLEVLEIDDKENLPAIRQGWIRALLFTISSLISSFVVATFAFLLVVAVGGTDTSNFLANPASITKEIGPLGMCVVAVFQFGGMFLILWIFRKFIDKETITSLGFTYNGFKRDLLSGLIFGTVFISVGYLFLSVLGNISVSDIQWPIEHLVLNLIFFTIVAFNEEIMVRGYILNNLMQSMNKYIALSISSIIFVIIHLGNANLSLSALINLFLAGIILGIYYIHKQNLWFPIGMHLTWNYFQGPVFGFVVSGNETHSIITQHMEGDFLITGGEFGFEGSVIASVLIVVGIFIIHFRYNKKY